MSAHCQRTSPTGSAELPPHTGVSGQRLRTAELIRYQDGPCLAADRFVSNLGTLIAVSICNPELVLLALQLIQVGTCGCLKTKSNEIS